ncbi:MAG TPA: FAD-dependent oxidoreductase [Candidatus Polarisedimenticolaceae bacterium]|nr:FAD-dependent oxidoreductase [Candidatus Polarisedimenticolaceae bacterium]
MSRRSAVILGGGLAGMGAAWTLARSGWDDLLIVERGKELGGLAGTFTRGEHFYPLAYHHILHRDRTLLYFLDRLGALERVRWRRIRMLFRLADRPYALGEPGDFLRFPMTFGDKLRFARLMLRCSGKSDWTDWSTRSAAELVDAWAGPGVRRALFEPLTQLKFRLPAERVSGAWLGARLHFREGSAPLGYIPGTNWTKVLCDGLAERLARRGVRVELGREVRALRATDGRVAALETDDGPRPTPGVVVSTVPTEVYRRLSPDDTSPGLDTIRYTAVVSMICATRQSFGPDFYWMNLPTLDYNACGLFRLESLNPTIGAPGEACINFVTHLPHRDDPFFERDDEAIVAGYRDDFRRLFGLELQPFWVELTRLPMYSPVFETGYVSPPVRSRRFANLYFAGNYRTFPSIASTGTALASGVEAGVRAVEDLGDSSPAGVEIQRFRLRSMPRP